MDRLREPIGHAQELLGKDIWELEYLGRRTVRARVYLLLRVLTLTWQGLRRNKIPVQAAALTFYSLIGIGPLIALAIMLSGFAIEQGSEEKVIQGISKVIAFAAPQVALDVDGPENGATELNPQIYEMIQGFSQSAQSGVGFVGLGMLFFIGFKCSVRSRARLIHSGAWIRGASGPNVLWSTGPLSAWARCWA